MSENENLVCVDVYTKAKEKWMDKYQTANAASQYGGYFTLTVPEREKNSVIHECKKRHIRFRWYEKRWARSSDYREKFFAATKGPYRCRYCYRRLSRKYMVIDHIIPVAKAKKSKFARFLLESRGIHTVNDVRNLCPSCSKCNSRKSDKMGLWVIRGWLGKYRIFHWIYRILRIAVIVGIICIIYCLHNGTSLEQWLDPVIQWFEQMIK